jgi:exopolysaccharide biosynthesis polyprenyl glycosylphosphotransferase
MRKYALLAGILELPVDFIVIFGAAVTAYFLRFKSAIFPFINPPIERIPFQDYLGLAAAFALTVVILFALLGLYSFKAKRKFFDELFKIIAGCSLGVLGVITALFFSLELFASRFVLLAIWAGSIFFVIAGRTVLRIAKRILLSKGKGAETVVIVGEGRNADVIASSISEIPGAGFKVIGRFTHFNEEARKTIEELNRREQIDILLALNSGASREELVRILDFTDQFHITFKYSADFFAARAPKISQETLFGVPLLEVKRTALEGWGRIAKRIFDIVGSLILIIFTSPVMILAAIAITLDSRGPIFFSRLDDGSPLQRVGQYGKLFHYFKFRSMMPNTDSWRYTKLKHLDFRKGPLVKIKDDPRVTAVGKFLRKFSIDELPELFLVLKGNMSLVGPRPHLPEEVAEYKKEYKKLFLVKPGITGLAQVSGRSDLSFDEEARLDMFYIENWSLPLDLIILLKTPWVALRGVAG